ncbi:unnamed protein product, partial [Brenthis ino]
MVDMDDAEKDTTLSYISHNRSPTFSKEEVNALVNLIEKYKYVVLNKSTKSTTSYAKEVAWTKISKEMNKQGFKYTRSVDSLKTKWENLKKEARKASKNLLNRSSNDYNVICQIVTMINEMETTNGRTDISHNLLQEINNDIEDDENNSSKLFDDNDGKLSDDSEDADENRSLESNRSLNFSPQECSLLLKCIRDEKKHIFSKETTGKATNIKNNAWSRITYAYNKLNPNKRTTKVLRTKFNNMKRLAKGVNFQNYFPINGHEKLEDDSSKDINLEPQFEYKVDMETDYENDNADEDFHDGPIDSKENNQELSDPLSLVLNGDSGMGSISHFGSYCQENKEVVKLKLELLKYQLETAKLERKRVEEALQAESAERQSRAIEASLQLRAARLRVVAAEASLPPAHPALRYPAREALAQQYAEQACQIALADLPDQ